MRKFLILFLAAVLSFAPALPAAAHEVGDKIGPVLTSPGGAICDTEAQVRRSLDWLDSGNLGLVDGCGTLAGGNSYALIEVIGMHESSKATYMILKIIFLPPTELGVQYGWQVRSSEHDSVGFSI